MSEYQHYEFQAVDRPLTTREMRELRAVSTRAAITPAHFVNFYTWGDFKGKPSVWMERYFDAFLYHANWGTHELMLRLPRPLLSPETRPPLPRLRGGRYLEMPTNACQRVFECGHCGLLLRPKPGDCCVFCSYGSVPCPPVQSTGDVPGHDIPGDGGTNGSSLQ